MKYNDFNIERNTKRVETQYWIDRIGHVHKYKGEVDIDIVSLHSEIAWQLFPDLNDPKTKLVKNGWIQVGSVVFACPIISKKPSQSQINTLDRLGLYDKLLINYNDKYINYDKYKDLF